MSDVIVVNHGTTSSFHLLSADAWEFVNDFVHTEPWQWLGSALVVDHRFTGDLIREFAYSGLNVRVE